MQPPSGDFKNPVESLRPAIQPAASRQAEKAMRTPSAIAAELEDAFVGGKPERELLVLIRELRAAIASAYCGVIEPIECTLQIVDVDLCASFKTTEFRREHQNEPVVAIEFRAADIVRHIPTGEKWVLATDQVDKHVTWCGWPEGTALANDCKLIKRASDEERHDMLVTWSQKTGNDLRIRWAKLILGAS